MVGKVGSTPETQGATESKKKQQKQESGYVEGVGQTFSSEKRQFGGLKKKKE